MPKSQTAANFWRRDHQSELELSQQMLPYRIPFEVVKAHCRSCDAKVKEHSREWSQMTASMCPTYTDTDAVVWDQYWAPLPTRAEELLEVSHGPLLFRLRRASLTRGT